jgi:hypothetical protein
MKLIAHKKGIQLKIQYPDPSRKPHIRSLVTALQHHINIGLWFEINREFLNNKPSFHQKYAGGVKTKINYPWSIIHTTWLLKEAIKLR